MDKVYGIFSCGNDLYDSSQVIEVCLSRDKALARVETLRTNQSFFCKIQINEPEK